MRSATKKPLEQSLPEGQIVNRAWLKARGFNRPRVDYNLRAGKLKAVAQGVYRRPGPPLKWEHIVYSLNEMGCHLRVGGLSALELQGMTHCLPAGNVSRIDLHGPARVPSWISKFSGPFRFEVHNRQLFSALPQEAQLSKPFGFWDWHIPYSTVELATLEMLAGIRDKNRLFCCR